jgi:uncharacterized protein (TIGR03435 family)
MKVLGSTSHQMRGTLNLITSTLKGLHLAALVLYGIGGINAIGRAQEVSPSVSFEVISVKPSNPDCKLLMIGPSLDGFHLHCLTLRDFIMYAYDLNLFDEQRVVGIPAWGKTEHFDLDAPIQEADLARFRVLPPSEKARLLRIALAERFALKTHEEQREMKVYALVQSKARLKLKAADPGAAEKPILQQDGRDHVEANHCTMEQFASFLSPLRGRPVVDRTDLSGKYDFSINFQPETDNESESESSEAPSIFTAVQEQLGLRLAPDKSAQRILVIDVVNQPTPN